MEQMERCFLVTQTDHSSQEEDPKTVWKNRERHGLLHLPESLSKMYQNVWLNEKSLDCEDLYTKKHQDQHFFDGGKQIEN